MPTKSNYTDHLKDRLRLDTATESDVVREISTHIEDKKHELIESGLSERQATAATNRLMGSPELVARQIYEVYSQGSWLQAIFAALPHLLVAAFFALHWWQNTLWLLGILVAVIGTVLYGWFHGKPAWLFPWLGYCLLPVIAVGILLIYLPGGWAWLAASAYIPLALIIIFSVTKKITRKDWVFASLMLLPVPIMLGWILVLWMLALEHQNGFLSHEQLYEFAPLIALTFAVLALTVTAFIRVKQRWLKVGVLLTLEIFVLIIMAVGGKSLINLVGWLGLILLAVILVLGPALMERKIRQASHKPLNLSRKSVR
ncbi:MAG: permease prefix domain 1-containing protein [Dehalococcoidia bacterium]|nr:permease prefix domain 1-containing protein [Dehalococcoidia bacterium]